LNYISAAEHIGVSLTTFTQCAPKATEFGEMAQCRGHYAVQSHSRSPNLV